VLLGFVLSIGLPVGLLYTRLQFDPRVRLPAAIEQRLKLPVLGTVPHLWSSGDTAIASDDVRRLAMLVGATMAVIVVVSVLRFVHTV
jgi:hypothetical protein